MISENTYASCLNYIEGYWKDLTFHLPKDKGIHVGLPNPFVAPSSKDGIFENDQFYWDSYFIILGLVENGKTKLAKGMVDNFIHLHKRFSLIPHRNRFYDLGRSQPPFLTSMILEVFNKTKDTKWLQKAAEVAENELKHYWMGGHHLAYRGPVSILRSFYFPPKFRA